MPIHLPPLSRRGFIKGSLASASSLFLTEYAASAANTTDESTWALISDTHVAADATTVSRNVNMADNLRKAVADVRALAKKPLGVIVSGDCAYLHGNANDYATFKGLIQPVRKAAMPVHLMMGNHDHREHFHAAFADQALPPSPVENHYCGFVKSKLANWFLLDSLEETNKTPGILGEVQLAWLAKQLDANTSKPALIMVHHNISTPLSKTGLKDSDSLLEVLRGRRQVKAVFYGHTHVWEIKPDESGIHLINLPACAYTFKDTQPNGWVHATLNASSIKLKLNTHDDKHPLAGEVKDLAWRA